MFKQALSIAVISSVGLLSGCAHTITPYSPSFQNISALQKMKSHSAQINLGDFTDLNSIKSIACRAEGSETLPGGETYVQYIKSALTAELKNAGLYSATSTTKLDATLEKVDFSSFGQGKWFISMSFNDHRQAPYTVSSTYGFSVNLIADIGCSEVAQAFVPATQKFLGKLYQNSHFRQTLKNR